MKSTVLFVDDDERLTSAARVALTNEPLDVLTANSAKESMHVLRSNHVDVVVSDERMPEMSGSAFLTAVRQEFPDVQRVILTGNASVDNAISAINDAHVFRFLTKPCPIEDLVRCINDATESRRARLVSAQPIGATDQKLGAAFSEALAGAHMVYQPIYSVSDERIHAYEALLRVDCGSFSSPDDLIEAATQLDRQIDLDRRVRELVADDLVHAPDDMTLFVNILSGSLHDPELLDGSGPLAEHAERVVLEITEREPLDAIDDVEGKFAQLRGLGYRLALDDLGAGYAGLTSFAVMQPEIVKFDMGLIRDIHLSPTRGKLISSMVDLCRDLGIFTVAEGVESTDELKHLVKLGCDLFQGHAICEPLRPFVELK